MFLVYELYYTCPVCVSVCVTRQCCKVVVYTSSVLILLRNCVYLILYVAFLCLKLHCSLCCLNADIVFSVSATLYHSWYNGWQYNLLNITEIVGTRFDLKCGHGDWHSLAIKSLGLVTV